MGGRRLEPGRLNTTSDSAPDSALSSRGGRDDETQARGTSAPAGPDATFGGVNVTIGVAAPAIRRTMSGIAMNISLKDKVCLVTGGSRGIGKAIVLALAESGATVAFDYRERRDAAEAVLAEVEERGGRAAIFQADVSDVDAVNAMVEAVREKFGPVSILDNNADINRDKSFSKLTHEQWDEVLSMNLSGAFNVTKAVMPDMLEQKWGRIVNVSSIVGQRGNFGQANYAAAKAGLIGFTKTVALETARKGVTANAPGFIDTDMMASVPEDVLAKICATIPVARMGKPEEIAPIVVFLASDQAAYITGQVIAANGGLYM